ncbi:MAG: redoxin domain-containing protein [Bacteroidetes bacterium]|nr:redoxin domain-containing protein [Bacteroidota bacterium]
MKSLFLILSLLWLPPSGLIEKIQIETLDSKMISIDHYSNYKATVIYFLSPECPLCQSYSLNINQLKSQFESKGFRFFGIVSGTYFNKTQVKNFTKEYKLSIPVYMDTKTAFAKQLHATITPEVFVLGKFQETLYSGRIDNWAYELSRKRKIITEHNLLDALTAIDKKQKVKTTKTKAEGSYIE